MIPAKYRINIIWSEEDNCYLVAVVLNVRNKT